MSFWYLEYLSNFEKIIFYSLVFLQFIILLDIAKEPPLVYTKWYESFDAKVFFLISWTMSSLLIMAEYRIVLPSSTNVRIGDFFRFFVFFQYVSLCKKEWEKVVKILRTWYYADISLCMDLCFRGLFNYLGLVQKYFKFRIDAGYNFPPK